MNKYIFQRQVNNVYLIDAGMFGFKNYMSTFLVKGKELALIDTGLPDSLENVRNEIKSHGFSVGDISYIFLTHEHHDHSGNIGPLLRENPQIKVYVHPEAGKWIIDPSQEVANRKENLTSKLAGRFATMEAVPESKLNYFKDGETFDLGNGEKLKIMFAPGHQPGGVVIFEEKNKGLFINDLVGNCFADCNFQLILNPPRSDIKLSLDTLKKLQNMSFNYLYLGHFGISENPQKLITGAIEGIQKHLDIGARCLAERKPEKITPLVHDLKMQEAEKLKSRSLELYNYISGELILSQARLFSEYYLSNFKK
jgi:glyoxylase-like metal-dependent hydrolase (beta-lactamase superfamily II)